MASGSNKGTGISEESEQLRAQLQSRSVLLFVTLASIGDAVITTDPDGDITFLNPVAEDLTGWNLADAVGLSIETVFQLVNAVTGEPVENPVRKALATVGKVDLPDDTILIRKDGSRIPIDDSGAPILGMEAEILGAILVFRDITELKRTEQMIRYRSELDRMVARISTAFVTSSVTEVDALIDSTLKDIGLFFDADRSYVFLYDRKETKMICTNEWCGPGTECQKGLIMPTSFMPLWTRLITSRRYVRVSSLDDIPADAEAERAAWQRKGLKSFLAIPMSQEDRAIGFIGLDSIKKSTPWPEETINALYLIGNVFASALARRDAQRKLDAARAREVEIGSRIQQTLLLSTPPLASADFQISALTIPSRGIDGDFYDFLLHPNRSLDIIFGDVMGKGVPAALLSAGAKTEFLRSLSHLLVSSPRGAIPQPQAIVNGVHSVLTPQLLNLDTFVTLTYARFDPQTKKVALVDCGNTRLIRCSKDDGKVDYLSGSNLPLGFSDTEVYTQSEYDYTSGDIFILYSDGVTEARSPEGEMFGRDRLRDLVIEKQMLPPELIVESIRDAVTDFVGSTALSDDLTCVAIRVVPDITITALPSTDELIVASNLDELRTIRAFLRGFCEQWDGCGLAEHELNLVELAVNEVASNIMRHAYHGKKDRKIAIHIGRDEDQLVVRLTHNGDAFISTGRISVPSLDTPREGGFGLFIISQAVDRVEYGQDAEGRQYIELMKKCEVV